jgi:hypothetical protein
VLSESVEVHPVIAGITVYMLSPQGVRSQLAHRSPASVVFYMTGLGRHRPRCSCCTRSQISSLIIPLDRVADREAVSCFQLPIPALRTAAAEQLWHISSAE